MSDTLDDVLHMLYGSRGSDLFDIEQLCGSNGTADLVPG